LFTTCLYRGHGSDGYVLILPTKYADRWLRQTTTSYFELPDSERESDRKEARRMIAVFNATSRATGETTVGPALAERKQVRSVLDMLRRGPKTTACWCTGGFHSPPQHSVACKAAHRLYEHVSETVAQVRATRTEGEGEKL
jgi:hypothetical protein